MRLYQATSGRTGALAFFVRGAEDDLRTARSMRLSAETESDPDEQQVLTLRADRISSAAQDRLKVLRRKLTE